MTQLQTNFKVKRSSAGLGLFTLRNFKKGEYLIDYTGELITTDEADERGGRYLFEVNSKWTIDGKGRENLARYINHSCRPNCEPEIQGKRIKIFALRNIKEGEELHYDYGQEYMDDIIIPDGGCKCAHCQKKAKKASGDSE